MLHAIEIENFRSFGDRTRIEFIVENPRKLDYRYVKRPCGVTVARLAVFMGANASGKTNILQAMNYLRWFISESNFVKDTADFIPPLPFLATPPTPCAFAVEFDIGGTEIYRYDLSVTPNFKVESERLRQRRAKSDWGLVFARNVKDEVSHFEEGSDEEWKRAPQKATATLTSSIIQGATAPGENPPGRDLAQRIVALVDRSISNLPIAWHELQPKDEALGVAGILAQNPALMKEVCDFVVTSDTGIRELRTRHIKVQGKDGVERDMPLAEFGHELDGKLTYFANFWESSGTRGMAMLLTHMLPTAKVGGMIAIDEAENHLHPHLIPKVVRALLPHGTTSQLFLVTHSDMLLREIDRRQLHLVEKKESGRSTCYRADRIKGLKSDRNLLAWYHTGALGGIPLL